MKGFKKDGKFRPTEKRKKSTLKKQDVKFKKPVAFGDNDELVKQKSKPIPEQKVTNILHFQDLDEDAKERAREWWREGTTYETFYADFDGYFYDKKTKLSEYDVFNNTRPTAWNVGYGHEFIQFNDLEIKDEAKLYKLLGLPKSLMDKVDVRFNSERNETNTEIEFWEHEGQTTLRLGDFPYEEYKEASIKYDEKPMSKKEFNALENATEKWNDLMDDAVSSLSNSYDWEQSDEHIDEVIAINEYEFDEEGNRI